MVSPNPHNAQEVEVLEGDLLEQSECVPEGGAWTGIHPRPEKSEERESDTAHGGNSVEGAVWEVSSLR